MPFPHLEHRATGVVVERGRCGLGRGLGAGSSALAGGDAVEPLNRLGLGLAPGFLFFYELLLCLTSVQGAIGDTTWTSKMNTVLRNLSESEAAENPNRDQDDQYKDEPRIFVLQRNR
jgi:hypothetical protein